MCDSLSQYPLSNLCGQIFLLIERILIVPLLFLVLSFEAHHLLIVLSVSHFFFLLIPLLVLVQVRSNKSIFRLFVVCSNVMLDGIVKIAFSHLKHFDGEII